MLKFTPVSCLLLHMKGGTSMGYFLAMLMLSSSLTSAHAASIGYWKLLNANVGLASHNTAVLPNTTKVILLDRTDVTGSTVKLPGNVIAHSLVYDYMKNSIQPLKQSSNTWCSAGVFRKDGRLYSVGGSDIPGGTGAAKLRLFRNGDAGLTDIYSMVSRRWYPTVALLPNDQLFILGGKNKIGVGPNRTSLSSSNNPTYEYYPPMAVRKQYDSPLLKRTLPNNLYPIVVLLPTGKLFIFGNMDSVIFDWQKMVEVKQLPQIPVGPRSYPSTAAFAFLPLQGSDNYAEAIVMFCGGNTPVPKKKKSWDADVKSVPAFNTCAEMDVLSPNPKWRVQTMPDGFVMAEGVTLADGSILFVNGAHKGLAGYESALDPKYRPTLYTPWKAANRFSLLAGSVVDRGYHSTANLLPDGRVLVAGSNAREDYDLHAASFPTRLSVEAFYPPYYQAGAINKPKLLAFPSQVKLNQAFTVAFAIQATGVVSASVLLIVPSYHSHSIPMGERAVVLPLVSFRKLTGRYEVTVKGPRDAYVAPPGFYMLFLNVKGVPTMEPAWVYVS